MNGPNRQPCAGTIRGKIKYGAECSSSRMNQSIIVINQPRRSNQSSSTNIFFDVDLNYGQKLGRRKQKIDLKEEHFLNRNIPDERANHCRFETDLWCLASHSARVLETKGFLSANMPSRQIAIPQLVLLLLIVQTIILPCLSFAGGICNRQRQFQTNTFAWSGSGHFRCRSRDDHEYEPEMNGSKFTRWPRVHKRGTGKRGMGSSLPKRGSTTTQLLLHPSTGASLAIVGSSLFGMQISRFVPSGGILGTLIMGAFFGNVCTKWIPNQHPVYDLCFSLFLPCSLTLLLLAYRAPENTIDFDGAKDQIATNSTDTNTELDMDLRGNRKTMKVVTRTNNVQNSISACIRRIAMPFLITSLSSLLGCWLSYQCALTFRWFRESASLTTIAIDKARELAKITTGCMSASYVGGSVNFMSTARIVGAPTDLLGSLLTADLFTMAIYFSFLSSSLDWEWLRSKFGSVSLQTKVTTEETSEDKKIGKKSLKSPEIPNADTLSSLKPNTFCFTSILLLFSTFSIVRLANRVEDFVGRFIPGSACALIAIVAPLLNSLVQGKTFWKPFSEAAIVWSDFFFLSFFASIGVAANLSSALSIGPACLLFSAIALTVHVVVTVTGCLLWNKIVPIMFSGCTDHKGINTLSLDLEDVWIASNAAIGGPATAATFCGQMTKRDPCKLQGRTISATFWGVVGYAIGTIVGVGMYRML